MFHYAHYFFQETKPRRIFLVDPGEPLSVVTPLLRDHVPGPLHGGQVLAPTAAYRKHAGKIADLALRVRTQLSAAIASILRSGQRFRSGVSRDQQTHLESPTERFQALPADLSRPVHPSAEPRESAGEGKREGTERIRITAATATKHESEAANRAGDLESVEADFVFKQWK